MDENMLIPVDGTNSLFDRTDQMVMTNNDSEDCTKTVSRQARLTRDLMKVMLLT